MGCIEKYSWIVFSVAFVIIVVLSCGENYKFWKDLSSVLIVVLIFTISSLWAVRTSAFYSSAQERNNFYQYTVDHKENYKWYKNKKELIKDPASTYLFSSRVKRADAIIYNMILFYLFICLLFLFIQFLFNLKEGNISALFLLIVFSIISISVMINMIRKCLHNTTKEIVILVTLYIILLVTIVIFYVKYDNLCFQQLSKVLPPINIPLFLIILYLLYLASRVHYLARSKYDVYNGFVIWTYDNMDAIPFLKGKDDPDRHPVVKKEKEMINLWKWSLVLNLKEIFVHMNEHGNINEDYRLNKERVENLNGALAASEWDDPSIIYICAVVRRVFSFLRIDNCPVSNESRRNSRDNPAKEAAEKRWRDKEKELEKLENDLVYLRYSTNEINDPNFHKKVIEKECEIKKLRKYIEFRAKEIDKLKNLFKEIDNIIDFFKINKKDYTKEEIIEQFFKFFVIYLKYKWSKNNITFICNDLIEIYKNRTKN